MAGGSSGSTPEVERIRARLDRQTLDAADLGGRVAVAEAAAAAALTTAQASASQVNQNRLDILVFSGSIGRPAWSVDRFGAVAGSSSVDTAAAIEAACAAHGAAYLPGGPEGKDWFCQRGAALPSNCKVHGDDNGARLLFTTDNARIGGLAATEGISLLESADRDGGNSVHHSGILVEGFHLDGNGDNQQTQDGAIAAVALHGDDHTVQGCTFTGFRPGASKEVFWVNISGTTGTPARNARVLSNVFADNAGQANPGSTECSLILIAGYPVDGAAEDIATDGVVSGNLFRDLVENGTTHNRTVHAIALMGADGIVSHNRMRDCTGDSNFIHYNSGSVLRQTCIANKYHGTAAAVALFRGLVSGYDPDYQYLDFIGNHFVSSGTCMSLVHFSDGTGVLENLTVQNNTVRSTGSGTAAIAFENRRIDQMAAWKVVHNTLDGESGTGPSETGAHILFTSAAAPAGIGAATAVPATAADKILMGDNTTESLARATMRAYKDSAATPITWTTNANWGATDL